MRDVPGQEATAGGEDEEPPLHPAKQHRPMEDVMHRMTSRCGGHVPARAEVVDERNRAQGDGDAEADVHQSCMASWWPTASRMPPTMNASVAR